MQIGSSRKVALGAFVAINLIFMATGQANAISIDGLDSSRPSVIEAGGTAARSGTIIFHFMASGLCSPTTNQCMEFNGGGKIKIDRQLEASGHFLKYDKDGVKQSASAGYYAWKAKELVNSNAIRVHLKALTGLGTVDIAVTEGKTPNSGLVCVWGTLEGVTGQNETLCTNKVTVYIN